MHTSRGVEVTKVKEVVTQDRYTEKQRQRNWAKVRRVPWRSVLVYAVFVNSPDLFGASVSCTRWM